MPYEYALPLNPPLHKKQLFYTCMHLAYTYPLSLTLVHTDSLLKETVDE